MSAIRKYQAPSPSANPIQTTFPVASMTWRYVDELVKAPAPWVSLLGGGTL